MTLEILEAPPRVAARTHRREARRTAGEVDLASAYLEHAGAHVEAEAALALEGLLELARREVGTRDAFEVIHDRARDVGLVLAGVGVAAGAGGKIHGDEGQLVREGRAVAGSGGHEHPAQAALRVAVELADEGRSKLAARPAQRELVQVDEGLCRGAGGEEDEGRGRRHGARASAGRETDGAHGARGAAGRETDGAHGARGAAERETDGAHGARGYHGVRALTARAALVHRRPVRPDELWVELAVPASIGEGALAACEATLSAEERARAGRMRVPAARRGFVVAHGLLRAALSRAVPLAPGAFRFREGPRGKPELAGPPEAAALRFSLSHTDGLVACALAREVEIGVDVERGARLRDPLALAERFFAPAEAAALRGMGAEARRERFLDAWVVKEALLKGRGLGIAGALGAVVVHFDEAGPRVAFAEGFGDDPQRWQIELLRPTGVHRLGLAVARGARPDLALRVGFAEGLLAGA